MSVPSQLRSSYINLGFSMQLQRRSLFPEPSTSTLLNFQSSDTMNSMVQAKQEMSLDLLEDTEERKRRPEQHDLMFGSYLLQSSTWAIPVMSRNLVWMFPSVSNNAAALYRGNMSSGLHFMNFPPPVTLMPGQQLGSGIGAGGAGGNSVSEGHLNMFAGFNSYRPISGTSVSESQASGSHSHHGGGGGDDRHDTTSHHS